MATYYIDSSITDTNVASATPDFTTYDPTTFATTGGSASVYKTIADVNAKVFSAGDFIYFRRGQTWREQLTVSASGSAGNVITYSAFGSGTKPIINGSNLVTPGTSWTATSGAYSTVASMTTHSFQNLNVRNVSAFTLQANEWVASESFSVTRVRTWGRKVGSPTGNIFMQIWDESGGSPNASIGQSDNIDVSTLTSDTGGQEISFIFSTPVSLTSGNLYFFAVGGTWAISGTNYVKVYGGATFTTFPDRWYYTPWTEKAPDDYVLYMIVEKTLTPPANIWQTATTEPNAVWFDTVVGYPETALANLNAAREWFWSANILYVYSESDPDTLYTSPGIEYSVRDYCIHSVGKDYYTIDNIDVYGANGIANILINDVGSSSTGNIVQNSIIRQGRYTGIYLFDVTSGIIQDNYIHHIYDGKSYAENGTGQGITLYPNTGGGSIIRRNKIESNYRGIFLFQGPLNTQIYYNLVKDNYLNGIDQFQTNAAAGPTLIYNNTIIHTPLWNDGHGIVNQDAGAAGFTVKNNILYSAWAGSNNNVQLIAIPDNNSENIDYNLYYLATGSTCVIGKLNSTSYSTMATWKTALTAGAVLGEETNGINSDPVLTYDYKLGGGSAGIDAGTAITGLHTGSTIVGGDAGGNTKLYGSGVDIGAYERPKFLSGPPIMKGSGIFKFESPKIYTVP